MSAFKLDWFSATIPHVKESLQEKVAISIATFMGPGWIPGRGALGYRYCLRHVTGARILWGGRDDMGVHVDFPASALAFWGKRVRELWLTYPLRCTRLDIAGDTEEVTVDQIVEAQDAIVTRAQARRLIVDLSGGGKTLYIGALTSGGRKLVRIYDKGKQLGSEGTLTRVEVQLRGEYADGAYRYVSNGGGVGEVVARAIDFRHPGAGPKRSWARLAWWAKMLGELVGDFRFPAAERFEEAISRVEKWLKKQVSRAVVLVVEARGRQWLDEFLDCGYAKLGLSPGFLSSS